MPRVSSLRPPKEVTDTDSDIPQVEEAEKIKLFLPSACPTDLLQSESMKPLALKEAQLRLGQAYDALDYIKKLRRILAGISIFKHQNVGAR